MTKVKDPPAQEETVDAVPPSPNGTFGKATLPTAELRAAVEVVARAIAPKPIVLSASMFLVEVGGGQVRLEAYDFDKRIVVTLPCRTEGDARRLIPGKLFADYLGTVGSKDLELVLGELKETSYVVLGRAKARFNGMAVDSFPGAQPKETAFTTKVGGAVFKQAVGAVDDCAAKDSTRPILQGVYMRLEDLGMTLCTADGFRLAEQGAPLLEPSPSLLTEIIPLATMMAVAASIDDEAPGSVTIRWGGDARRVIFETTRATFETSLIEGQFPDYKRIIPENPPTVALLKQGDLLPAVRAAGVFGSARRIDLEFLEGKLAVHAVGDEGDGADCDVDIALTGPVVKLGVNAYFLRDALRSMGGGEISMGLTSATSPLVVKKADGSSTALYVIMPMSRQ